MSAVAHCIGIVMFGGGAMQHALLTNVVLASTRGKEITDTSPWLVWLIKFRQRATDMAPLVLLATPLLGQMFSRSPTRALTSQSLSLPTERVTRSLER